MAAATVRRTARMLDEWKDGEVRDVMSEMMRLDAGDRR